MIDDETPTTPTTGPELTGRQLITFTEDSSHEQRVDALRALSGIDNVASSADADNESVGPESFDAADATLFDRLGIAVAEVPVTQEESFGADAEQDPVIVSVEPEHVVHALTVTEGAAQTVETPFSDSKVATWGLQATKTTTSTATGDGIRVAVLDTGFDLEHPDFAGRPVTTRSFILGQGVQDGNGHGTHCIGTSCGPKAPDTEKRYGVASSATIFAGKVLSNEGSGSDSGIIAGIEWALANECVVISMSLGADVRHPVQAYEAIGRRALAAGSLIIAAAGNNARRPGNPGFVGSPANSPSIMAVGALAPDMQMAPFSARATTVDGGAIDIAAPGLNVYASWPMPTRYRTISGTSMATPHVAGIAALLAETTGARGRDLWDALITTVQTLPLPVVDVGAGLATAP